MAKTKLKGLKRVDRIINEFTKQFGIEAHLGTDFCAYIEDREINYPIVLVDAADKYFVPFIQSIDPHIQADIFVISLLHEVGHIYTKFNLSQEEWDKDWVAKAAIDNAIQATEDEDEASFERLNNEYFNLPDEIAATKWALNYIKKHETEVAEFWAELQPAIHRFYRKNGVI